MIDGLGPARMLALTHASVGEDSDLLALTPSDMGAIIEIENVVCLAACSLDFHEGKSNWVEKAGGLPQYICEVARAILEGATGTKSVSRAIAIAVGRIKRWAVTSSDPKVKAKAAAAVADWEAKKARAHAD